MPRSYPRYRSTNCITVEHKTDLSDPANPLSHKTEFSPVCQLQNCEFLISHVPVPGCFFAQAALWSTKVSGTLSQSRRPDEIWLARSDSKRAFISLASSWNLWSSLSCNTPSAIKRLARISVISSSSFWRVLCRKGYVARRPAALAASFIPLDDVLLNFLHSSCSSWISSLQCIIDFSMLLTKLCSSAWNVRLDKAFSRCWMVPQGFQVSQWYRRARNPGACRICRSQSATA